MFRLFFYYAVAAEVEGETSEAAAPAGAHVTDVEDPSQLIDIDFDDGVFPSGV